DQFRAVNDNYGHPAGDAILVRVAERLAGAVHSTNTVARFGADAFAVLMEGDADTPQTLAQQVLTAFERPFVVADQELVVRPSIGL
ncbi:GGDEF-domain containing protein, partial [Mycobacterium sp. ITM-2017-0098]